MSDFWTRRKAAVEAEKEAECHVQEQLAEEQLLQEISQKDDDEILQDLGLPDPDQMQSGDDFSAFMQKTVPAHLRQRALRQLWRSNPILANVDGLVDYGQDFTDAGVGAGVVETTYQVGRGMLRHLEDVARKEKERQELEASEICGDAEVSMVDENLIAPSDLYSEADRTLPANPEAASPGFIWDDEDGPVGEAQLPQARRMQFIIQEAQT